MADTREELKVAWKKDNLKQYGVSLHKTYNADLIEYVERRKRAGDRTSEIFREGIEKLIEHESGK